MSHIYNEINPYRARVLRARIAEGRLPGGTVDERSIADIPAQEFCAFEQIHLFAGIGGFPLGLRIAGVPEHGLRVITGGFPCQDISNAGKRAGITGERSGLWREMVRAIRVVRPDLVFVENVAALLGRGMGRVVGDLAAIGYDAKWDCISANQVGAGHRRERIFMLCYPQQKGQQGYYGRDQLPFGARASFTEHGYAGISQRIEMDPDIASLPHTNGLSVGMVRNQIAALGDAIVPQACAEAIRRLMA